MTTLNARANQAWVEKEDEHPFGADAKGAFEEGWETGHKAAATDMLSLLRALRAEAITSERKSAYDRAIEAVEGLS